MISGLIFKLKSAILTLPTILVPRTVGSTTSGCFGRMETSDPYEEGKNVDFRVLETSDRLNGGEYGLRIKIEFVTNCYHHIMYIL